MSCKSQKLVVFQIFSVSVAGKLFLLILSTNSSNVVPPEQNLLPVIYAVHKDRSTYTRHYKNFHKPVQ